MSEDQPYFINNVLRRFPADFQSYVVENGLRYWKIAFRDGYAFWSPEGDHPAPCSQIREMIKSLLPDLCVGGEYLLQFWKATEIEGSSRRTELTTRDQPFCFTSYNSELCSHRLASVGYDSYVNGGSEEVLGRLSRVFRQQRLESTPDLCHDPFKDNPQYDGSRIWGSLALPVLEPSGSRCVGVLELVHNYVYSCASLKDAICRKLEDVGLKCLKTCNHLYGHNKDEDEALERALGEINEVLLAACKTHKLPFAQTWVLCRSCDAVFTGRSFNSRTDAEYYQGLYQYHFIKMSSWHHLQRGEGVVGRAFSSHNLVFCEDITQFSITEYPLAHYARRCQFTDCFAISLCSSNTGDNLYVIEFFLSERNMKGGDPRTTLVSLFATMRQHFQSFKVASGEELGEELSVEVIDFTKDGKHGSFQIPQAPRSPDHRPRTLGNGGVTVWPSSSGQQLMKENAIHTGDNAVSTTAKSNIAITYSQQNSQRQHRNTGIPISLEDVQKQRTKKLNDAAESLGVSRSTLKRACREYGIKWWQPCKRNKDVNQSLPNESVRGVDQPPISDSPREQDKAVEETSNVTIKAKYVDVFIKFQLPVSAGMVEFQQQVAKRLNLEGGTYTVKYKDDEEDWILIGCDEDLQDYISKSRSRGWDTVKMSLQPVITNCPP